MLYIFSKKFFLYVAFCMVLVDTSAQEAVFEQLSTLNGLSQNTVRCMMQDRNGFLWIGTINGLNRYDGFKFIHYKPSLGGLSEGRIKDIVEDVHGNIWVRCFNNKYHCLNPVTNSFLNYLSETTQNLTFNYFFQKSGGDICLSTANSGFLYLTFQNGGWVTYQIRNRTNNLNSLADDRVVFTYEDADKNLWAGCISSLGFISKTELENRTFKVKNYFFDKPGHIFVMADEDKTNIYFFTRKGVVIFNKTNKAFNYVEYASNANILNAIKFSPTEFLLVTTNKGVLVFNATQQKIIPYPKIIDPTSDIVAQIIHDKAGAFWVSNRSGNIWRIDSVSHDVRKFPLISPHTRALIDDERILIMTDKNKDVWISTYGEGLYHYNTVTGNMAHYLYNTANPDKLSSNYLLTLFCDRSGIVWVGTEHTGINKIIFKKNNIQTFYPDYGTLNPSSNFVRSIMEDRKGNIWVSTKDGKINIYNPNFEKKLQYARDINSLKIQGNIYCFFEDSVNNLIWLGTKGNGVYSFNPDNPAKSLQHYTRDANNIYSLSLDQIYSIAQDYKGRLWFATFGGGISLYTPESKTGNFLRFFSGIEGVKQVRCLLTDSKKYIWVGTSNGLVKFHPDSLLANDDHYTYYINNFEDNTSLSSNEVKAILEDRSGNIWIGTSNGLNRFLGDKDNKQGIFKHFYTQHGLSNDIVQALGEDQYGNVWIGTENGLSVYNPSANSFRNFRVSPSALGNLISELASVTLSSGKLVFGSAEGFYLIDPDNFIPDTTVYPVSLTNFYLSGAIVEPGINSILNKAIFKTGNVELSYMQNSFSIDFATFLYDNEHNYFSYILENYDDNWIRVTNSNSASYKNLNPGKYIFKVKYINPSGEQSGVETILNITIKPPLWRSRIAFLLYFVFAVLILIGIKIIIDRIHKLQHTIEVEKQVTEYKINFFTNISHEFRTPLSLILGSLERIAETIKLTPPLHKHLVIMQRNTNRLLQLMDQLLDFAKVQNKSMKLTIAQTEAIGLLKNIYNSFFDLAEKKNITYLFSSNYEKCNLYLDPDIVDKILYNLLSNAFKFTNEGGNIEVIVEINEQLDNLKIRVKDDGVGIPDDKQNLIFKRFAQIQTSTTGIGLSLTRELTELHKGEIGFTSKPGKGSEFTVILNTNPSLFAADEVNIEKNKVIPQKQQLHFLSDDTEDLPAPNEIEALNNYKVLIVEDNAEIRDYLVDYLSKYFKVEQASNGLEGIEKAIEYEPDLIVCDIVMPEMNGIEVTKKLKSEFQTSHIPILLLTAITSDEKKLEATEAGADEYITKPFNVKYLLTKIFKLIEQRETLRKKFSTDTAPINFTICKTDRDKAFLEKANRIAEQQIVNSEFSVDDFAKLAGLGRTVFYKKLKGITGFTPNEFIRVIRMKKALELLSTGDFTVSEVAHKVGMNDPFYFSRCFKAQFGQSPSVYNKGK